MIQSGMLLRPSSPRGRVERLDPNLGHTPQGLIESPEFTRSTRGTGAVPRHSTLGGGMKVLALGVALALVGDATGFASEEPSPPTQTVVAGAEFEASGLHRLFFGADYRDLWTTPVTVEVLDLTREAGGLVPVRRVGGRQSKGLALRGRDGLSYTFRGLQKDASDLLPEDLRGTIVDDLVQDQQAGQHPGSELVARGLLDAAGVPCPPWRLVVLPDDPALGEFRADFAGQIGTFAEYPTARSDSTPGYRGAVEIINHLELYKRLQEGAGDRANVTAFLKARLMDLFMGDWDRHRRQWRWARFPDRSDWTPIPEDRDQAFSRYEGLIFLIGRDRDPRFQNFGPRYGGLGGMTYNGRDQDRLLLVGLDRADFEAAASELQPRLTDAVIDNAVELLPAEWRSLDGPRLSRDLKARRDALIEIARAYYRFLAHEVDVHMTDRGDRVDATRRANGDLDVSVRLAGQESRTSGPYFHRVFHRGETDEVRLYGWGGDDSIVVSGGNGPIRLRAVGGAGDDILDDHAGGGTKFSDSEGNNVVVKGLGSGVDRRRYTPPPPPPNAPWIPPRDFGHEKWSIPRLGYGSDPGLSVGWGFEIRDYGFRKSPYASRHVIGGDYAFGARGGRLDYNGEFRRENRASFWGLRLHLSSVDVLRFYGFGNELEKTEGNAYYKVHESQALVFPSITFPMRAGTQLEIGPVLRYAKSDDDDQNLLNATRPYGVGEFGQVGLRGTMTLDSRDNRQYPRHGAVLGIGGTFWPDTWDVADAYGDASATANVYVPLGGALTAAARGGAKRVWGDAPYRDAAAIGGGGAETGMPLEPGYEIRGFQTRRFAGESALYGNFDLRLRLFRATILVPSHVGVFGLADAGRVWLEGEDSERWHTDAGGGIWLSALNYRGTFSAYIAHGNEGNIFRVGTGFTF